MPWTHTIGPTRPRPDNPLNLETTVTFHNSDTGEDIVIRPFGNDLNKSLRKIISTHINSVLPDRDAALAELTALDGTSIDLTPTVDELESATKQAAVQAAYLVFQMELRKANAVLAAGNNPDVATAFDALTAAEAALPKK